MVEVMDHWQDAGLTAGERADLLVIAENASDDNRETYPRGGIHQEYILKRVGKTAPAWRNAIGKLMKKGVLAYAVRDGRELSGFPGQVAVYRLAVLCPEAPHDGLRGQCTRPERVTSQVTQSVETEPVEPETGHLSGDPIDVMGHLTESNGSPHRWERVTSQVTPTPLTPLTPLSSPPQRQPVAVEPPIVLNDERETIAARQKDTTAQRAVAAANVVPPDDEGAFIDWINRTHNPRGPGWWRTVTAAGDFPELAAVWRAQQAGTGARPASPTLPPPCSSCEDANPAARFNPKFRTRNGHPSGQPCADCHPDAASVAA